MRQIRPIALAMANAIEKNRQHPVANHVVKQVSVDANYGVKNTYAVRVNAPKNTGMKDFQV